MFQVNDVIVYGTQGVCTIIEIEEKSISGSKKKYFVLKPVNEKSATVYAPTDNPHVLKKMRKLLTQEEIDCLIDSMLLDDTLWIDNENQRRERYRSILSGGDHRELIQMIRSIYVHKKTREAEGKRLHMSDERFFKDAEQILYNEFQYVLKLSDKNELMRYILARIGGKEA